MNGVIVAFQISDTNTKTSSAKFQRDIYMLIRPVNLNNIFECGYYMVTMIYMKASRPLFSFCRKRKKGEVQVTDKHRIRQLQKIIVMTWASEGSKRTMHRYYVAISTSTFQDEIFGLFFLG